jgi:hypothetical protein
MRKVKSERRRALFGKTEKEGVGSRIAKKALLGSALCLSLSVFLCASPLP